MRKPTPKPKLNGKCYVGARIPPDTKRKLEQMRERQGRTLSAEIEMALRQYTANEP